MASERSCFARHPFHHVPVAAQDKHVVVEYLEFRLIEVLGEPAPGNRHADAVSAPLSERARRRFDPRGQMIFGMTGTFATDLPEVFDIVERNRELSKPLVLGVYRFHARKMQKRIKQHRCVAV
jgi:hypothetical protein